MTQKSTDRAKKFIKDNYKTIKVYIDSEDYPGLESRAKEKGYDKINPYIKSLLQEDGALPKRDIPDPGIRVAKL